MEVAEVFKVIVDFDEEEVFVDDLSKNGSVQTFSRTKTSQLKR